MTPSAVPATAPELRLDPPELTAPAVPPLPLDELLLLLALDGGGLLARLVVVVVAVLDAVGEALELSSSSPSPPPLPLEYYFQHKAQKRVEGCVRDARRQNPRYDANSGMEKHEQSDNLLHYRRSP